ncbi:MAG: hypothetical protein V1926_02135 [Candidatus Peregrinibacteria bacterium]
MASPISITLEQMKTVLAWLERAAKKGFDPASFQQGIDNPQLLEQQIALLQGGGLIPVRFEEPQSHLRAREILGEGNFHGILAAQKGFGPYTVEELARRMPLRLYDQEGNPFTSSDEETLAVCGECKDTHILVATRALSLVGIHDRCKSRMANDQDAPWFIQEDQKRAFASRAIAAPWLLVRKTVVPDSWGKSQRVQEQHIRDTLPKERFILPEAYVYSALLHLQETGEKLCPGYVVRFPVQAADGHWVCACWYGEQLYVRSWNGEAYDAIASCTVRASK